MAEGYTVYRTGELIVKSVLMIEAALYGRGRIAAPSRDTSRSKHGSPVLLVVAVSGLGGCLKSRRFESLVTVCLLFR